LEWVASRPTPGVTVEVVPLHEVIDLRAELEPFTSIDSEQYAMWAEGVSPDEIPFDGELIITRHTPRRVEELVIWTAPPGRQELAQMIDLTGAHRFYVVAQHIPEPYGFSLRLAGLVKYAARVYTGGISILKLASATAQREVTVRTGLDLMVARGQITLNWYDGDHVQITLSGEKDTTEGELVQAALEALLKETAAFRTYFRQADLATFFE
jgi:hypothetical protein